MCVYLCYDGYCCCFVLLFFFFKQKTAYEMRISDWSSDVCSSDLQMSVRPRLFDGLEQRIAAARVEQIGRINQREFAGAVMAADEQLRAQAARTIDRDRKSVV